jgi:hypothetical protein
MIVVLGIPRGRLISGQGGKEEAAAAAFENGINVLISRKKIAGVKL